MKKDKNIRSKKSAYDVALYGTMTALAMIFGYIEHLIPFSIGIYGIKLGLANLAVVVMLYTVSPISAFIINMLRILLCGVLFGNIFSLVYSLAGGIFSFLAMFTAKKLFKFSCVGVSIIGGISHNMGQLLAASLMLDQLKIMFYFPVLLVSGAIAGLLIGMISLPIGARISKLSQKFLK